jgi:hypothetical protein
VSCIHCYLFNSGLLARRSTGRRRERLLDSLLGARRRLVVNPDGAVVVGGRGHRTRNGWTDTRGVRKTGKTG